MADFSKRIQELKLILPKPPQPVGAYQPVVMAGNIAYLSGQISRTADGKILTGKIGGALTLEQGQEGAKVAVLNVISLIQNLVGPRFERILRIVGYVQCEPSFKDIHLVMNPASELLQAVFGEKGIHARSAVGMASLPLDACVEIEATVQVHSGQS